MKAHRTVKMILHGQEGSDSLQIPGLEVENARSIPESKPTEKQWKEVFFFLRKKKRTEKRGTDQLSSKNSEEKRKRKITGIRCLVHYRQQ